MARYMGRMAKSGKVCTLIMMVMKAMYSRTLIKPGGRDAGSWSRGLAGRIGDAGLGQEKSRLPSPVNSSV